METKDAKYTWLCTHCRTPLDRQMPHPQPEEKPVFCCSGCKMVYEILHQKELGEYYRLKKEADFFEVAIPVQTAGGDFDYLDDPEYSQKYRFGEKKNKIHFYVEGIHCVACLWLLERINKIVPFVLLSQLDLGKSLLTVEIDTKGSFALVAETLKKLGYTPHPLEIDQQSDVFQQKENKRNVLQLGTAGFCMGNMMLLSISIYAGLEGVFRDLFEWINFFLILPIIFYCAVPFYKSAVASLKVKQINIDVPVSFALIFGFLLSTYHLFIGSGEIYYDSLAAFTFLLLSSRYFLKSLYAQFSAQSKASDFFIPQFVRKDQATKVPLSKIKKGDTIYVIEKEVIPVDGILLQEEAFVDSHLLTGEAEPVFVQKEEAVYAGTTLMSDAAQIKVSSLGSETRIAKIAASIEEAEKPKMVQFADRISKWFLSVTLLLSFGIFFFFSGHDMTEGFNRMLSLVIIACPCAFALATPLAYAIGLQRSRKIGVMLRGAEVLERLSQVKKIFFDKTGTLTEGRFSVLEWEVLEEGGDFYEEAYLLEEKAAHPIGKAIKEYCLIQLQTEKVKKQIVDWQEVLGVGVEGMINGRRWALQRIEDKKDKGDGTLGIVTQVGLFREGECLVVVTLGDHVSDENIHSVRQLQKRNYPLHILSGDSELAVRGVAKKFHIEDFHFRVSPELKQEIVSKEEKCLMVGDGANDAAALASSFVSIAVCGSLEMSFRSADAYLIRPGITAISQLFFLSEKVVGVIKWNILISLLFNSLGIFLAIAGRITPLFAAVYMPVSSLTVLFFTTWMLQEKKAIPEEEVK